MTQHEEAHRSEEKPIGCGSPGTFKAEGRGVTGAGARSSRKSVVPVWSLV